MIIDTAAIKEALIAGAKTKWDKIKKALIIGYCQFQNMKKSYRIIFFVTLVILASFLIVGFFSGRELSIKEHLAKAQEYSRSGKFSAMIPHLTIAAKKGSKEAQCLLGVCYATGTGIKKNDKEAFQWMYMAAKQGHAEAQYRLSGFYSKGVGVEEDMDRAMEYMILSAKQGHPQAVKTLNMIDEMMEPLMK